MTGDIRIGGRESQGIYAGSDSKGVTVVMTSDIDTQGTDSQGIDAYSESGNVKVDVTGKINTKGDDSDGILAWSDSIDSGNDNVEVTVKGDIESEGMRSEGIWAIAYEGDIRIAPRGGTSARELSPGIEFDDGAFNSLTIGRGTTVRTSGGTSDILGGTGDETIDNYGILTALGENNLDEGDNTFNNRTGATFNSGTSVILTYDTNNILDETFANAGDLSPGGAGKVQTTTLAGVFQNFKTDENGIAKKGTFTVTISPDGTGDLLEVSGVAFLGGTVRVVGACELTEVAVPTPTMGATAASPWPCPAASRICARSSSLISTMYRMFINVSIGMLETVVQEPRAVSIPPTQPPDSPNDRDNTWRPSMPARRSMGDRPPKPTCRASSP